MIFGLKNAYATFLTSLNFSETGHAAVVARYLLSVLSEGNIPILQFLEGFRISVSDSPSYRDSHMEGLLRRLFSTRQIAHVFCSWSVG